MKSVRLDSRLESRLRRAAKASGLSESEVIRQGVEKRTDEILSGELDPKWDGIIAAVRSGGGRADRASQLFAEHVVRKHRKSLKRRS